jgi:hypothetical protein
MSRPLGALVIALVLGLAACDTAETVRDAERSVGTVGTEPGFLGDADAPRPSLIDVVEVEGTDGYDGAIHTPYVFAFPSTNRANFGKRTVTAPGWAHVELVEAGAGQVTLMFAGERDTQSCFEFRVDDEETPWPGFANYNPHVADGQWWFRCVRAETITEVIAADVHVDVRLAYGWEREERFDWTRFRVTPDHADRPPVGPPHDTDDAPVEPPDDTDDAPVEPPDDTDDAPVEPPDDTDDAPVEPPDDTDGAPVEPPAFACDATFAHTTLRGDQSVPRAETWCYTDVRIGGNVTVGRGARLYLTDGRVDGNVEVGRGAHAHIHGTSIAGNVKGDGSGDIRVTYATVFGNLQIEDSVGAILVTASAIDGNVELAGSRGAIALTGARIDGNVELERSRGGVEVADNIIDGNLRCQENAPAPTGRRNTVRGNKEGQCRLL